MAVWSEISLSSATSSARLDPEFYRPEYVRFEETIRQKDSCTISDVVKVIRRGVQPVYTEDGEVPVLRTVNVRELELSTARQEFVTRKFAADNPRGNVQHGDVLITSTGIGTLGRVGYQSEPSAEYFADGHVTVLRGFLDIHPLYVATFLQTGIGKSLIEKRQRGSSGQMEVYPFDIATIPVPRTGDQEGRIVAKAEAAIADIRRATQAYFEAEEILSTALGLKALDRDPHRFSERSYSAVKAAGRFDAQFFQPKVQNLISALASGGTTLADVASLSKRRFRPAAGTTFNYVEIGDVSNRGTAEATALDGAVAPSRATWILKEGDVITTTVRPIRRLSAIVTNDQSGYVCSSGFAVLEPTDVPSEVLLVYLRLPSICELLDLYATASMYPAVSTADLMKLPFAVPSLKSQELVVSKVQESLLLRRQASQRLQEAKLHLQSLIGQEDV